MKAVKVRELGGNDVEIIEDAPIPEPKRKDIPVSVRFAINDLVGRLVETQSIDIPNVLDDEGIVLGPAAFVESERPDRPVLR